MLTFSRVISISRQGVVKGFHQESLTKGKGLVRLTSLY